MTTAIAREEMGTVWGSRAGDATFKQTNEETRQASRQDSLHADTKHAMATRLGKGQEWECKIDFYKVNLDKIAFFRYKTCDRYTARDPIDATTIQIISRCYYRAGESWHLDTMDG